MLQFTLRSKGLGRLSTTTLVGLQHGVGFSKLGQDMRRAREEEEGREEDAADEEEARKGCSIKRDRFKVPSAYDPSKNTPAVEASAPRGPTASSAKAPPPPKPFAMREEGVKTEVSDEPSRKPFELMIMKAYEFVSGPTCSHTWAPDGFDTN